ncbi:GIY-YIG nuclease family protein [Flavobacterium sp. GNP001]
MSCELSNWSGKAYKIPRIKIKDCSDRDDLKSTGVYLLFGKDDTGRDQVYIGEAESILKRLNQQLTQKDFWNEAIVFISKDDQIRNLNFQKKSLEKCKMKIICREKWKEKSEHITSTSTDLGNWINGEIVLYLG